MIFMFHSLFFSFLSFAFCTSSCHIQISLATLLHLRDGILDVDFGPPRLQVLPHHFALSRKGVVEWKLPVSLLLLPGLLLGNIDKLLLQYFERHSTSHFRLRRNQSVGSPLLTAMVRLDRSTISFYRFISLCRSKLRVQGRRRITQRATL